MPAGPIIPKTELIKNRINPRTGNFNLINNNILFSNLVFNNNDVIETGANKVYGILIIGEFVEGVSGVYRLENQNITVISQNVLFTTTKDNNNTYNIYWQIDKFVIQNKVGNDKNISIGFFGV